MQVNSTDSPRLLPDGVHVVKTFFGYQPYDPDACSPEFKSKLHYYQGALRGLAVTEEFLKFEMQVFRCSREGALRKIRERSRTRIRRALESDDLERLYRVPRKYQGQVAGASMSMKCIQDEIDALRREFSFEEPIAPRIVERLGEDVGARTIFLGLPEASGLHQVIFCFIPRTLEFMPRTLRYIIRHEFAHCVADIEPWKADGRSVSADHSGPEWERACEALGISSASSGFIHEGGCYCYVCPTCENDEYQLCNENNREEQYHCEDCGCLLEKETLDQPLALTEKRVYAIEEDGRQTPLPFDIDKFFGMVPDFSKTGS